MNTKYTKNGWPLSATQHRLGDCYAVEAERLVTLLKSRYGVVATFVPYASDQRMGSIMSAPTRLGINRYAEISAFIKGFCANR